LFAEVRPSAAPAAQQSAVTADMTTFTSAVSADALYNMASRVSSSGYTEAGNFRSSTSAGGGTGGSGGGRSGSGGGDGSDSSGDEATTSTNTRPRRNTRRQQRRSVKGYQDHHIISHLTKETRDHPLLRLAGFDLQSQANKIFLPKEDTEDMHPTRALHRGRHHDPYHEILVKKMDGIERQGQAANWTQTQYHDALLNMLREVRSNLKAGRIAFNSVARPQARK
jgi:hypothetical protein